MSTEKQYVFHGGPLHGQTAPGPTMGRIPTALDGEGNVIRVDKADQAIGLMARTNKPAALYLLVNGDGENDLPDVDTYTYAWIINASLVVHHGGKGDAL